jgi:hypothetical protein
MYAARASDCVHRALAGFFGIVNHSSQDIRWFVVIFYHVYALEASPPLIMLSRNVNCTRFRPQSPSFSAAQGAAGVDLNLSGLLIWR